MASGTIRSRTIVVERDSFSLAWLQDTSLSSPSHNELLRFNGSSYENTELLVEELQNAFTQIHPVHNTLFTFSDDAIVGWVDKNVFDLLTGLQVTVEGLVAANLAIRAGVSGNPSTADIVALTGDSLNGFTMGICSCGDSNVVYKRELTDNDFSFLQVMSRGEISNLALTAGTIFRSTKGLTGFSVPFCFPMGSATLSGTYFRFYALRGTVSVYVTSAGLESVVTLYSSDGVTIIDGPDTIPPYGSTQLVCNSNSEFVVTATTSVYGGTKEDNNRDMRLLIPSALETIVWNRLNRVTAEESKTLVRWYRQNGDTGSVTVNAGTPQVIYTGNIDEDGLGVNNAGNTVGFFPEGCLILRADKPISSAAFADGAGYECAPGISTTNLSQLFPNPATIGTNSRADRCSVSIGSPYEGTAVVYDDANTILATFTYTRSVSPATTPEEQLYPAAGQWQPLSIGAAWRGGYVICNTPAYCVMNFDEDTVFTTDAGEETMILGSTPEDVRAVIRSDASGMLRRRDVDVSGAETWEIC